MTTNDDPEASRAVHRSELDSVTCADSLTIVNTCVSSSGFNEFRYIIEHKINGVWSTADNVDIGRNHTDNEVAHNYRIIGEDWVGTQTFAYSPREQDWNVR